MEKKDFNLLIGMIIVFGIFYVVPYESAWFNNSVVSGVNLLNDYAKKHVLTCLVPALFIAGAIAVFIKKDRVLKYLGPDARPIMSYSIASVSGAILAVCSCTILPLFAGIKRRGAGLGPAITFLFSGPAINVAAIFLTMSVLGYGIGIARAVSAILISILVGLTMAVLFREEKEAGGLLFNDSDGSDVSKLSVVSFMLSMIMILIVNGLQISTSIKYPIIAFFVLIVSGIAYFKIPRDMSKQWLEETWSFSKLILPLLFMGVFIAGFIMPLLPEEFIHSIVGKNTVTANIVSSIFGAFMYFSTLTEIPILQALIAKGMHAGPALALLLAGPSLSLPNMLVIRGVLGTKKTAVYVGLVVFYSTVAGLIYGGMV